jgi:hypothetical protein
VLFSYLPGLLASILRAHLTEPVEFFGRHRLAFERCEPAPKRRVITRATEMAESRHQTSTVQSWRGTALPRRRPTTPPGACLAQRPRPESLQYTKKYSTLERPYLMFVIRADVAGRSSLQVVANCVRVFDWWWLRVSHCISSTACSRSVFLLLCSSLAS